MYEKYAFEFYFIHVFRVVNSCLYIDELRNSCKKNPASSAKASLSAEFGCDTQTPFSFYGTRALRIQTETQTFYTSELSTLFLATRNEIAHKAFVKHSAQRGSNPTSSTKHALRRAIYFAIQKLN